MPNIDCQTACRVPVRGTSLARKKGIDEAEAPDAVVKKIARLIDTKEPKFNPVGKMTGMILFLQNHAPKMFKGSILKSVKTA